jgi:class 3 adenylate cyclase/tetratricopeptide (TPR) repeat protein
VEAPSPEGELRQLTVVFCDLVGSTELSARFDPEVFGELLHSYQERSVAIASRYGGHVDKYLGDGILFHFGWPEAHDDDPERATRAALEIVDAIVQLNSDLPPDRDVAVRIGIHTGTVLIGEIGASGEPEMMAIGETVNLAARVQGSAQPNTVVISRATMDLVPGIFVVEDLGTRDLKGIAAPVQIYRAVQPSGMRSRLDSAGGALTSLIGREAELALLEDRWRRARSRGGQSVLVTGEAGVGKSRLVYELHNVVRDEPHSWLESRCSSYTDQSAFRPVIELIEQGLDLGSDETAAEWLEKLERGLASAGVRSADAVPLVSGLLGIPFAEGITPLAMSAERRRRRTIEVLVEWVLALARLQPIVVLVEDLHWCDPSSLELLGELLKQGTDTPLMLLATARPEFQPEWASRSNLTILSVSPLGEDQVREMVTLLGGDRELPEPVVERIVSESDGIPLYAEEVGRQVLESNLMVDRGDHFELAQPLSELDIPTTLQGSLMARLDRLSSAKRVAQLASAIGREFNSDLLAEVAGLDAVALRAGLDRLVESEVLSQWGEPPDASFAFKHALIQDAAYQSLLKRTRRGLHERIAGALENRLGADPLAAPEVVARHWETARRAEKAAANYRRAAEQAAERSGHREAIVHLRRAIELSVEVPESRERDEAEVEMQLALGASIIATRTYADPEIERAYERARLLCEALGDDARVAHALAGLAIYYLNRGQMELGAELVERVLEVAEREDDDALRLLGHVQLALRLNCQARFDSALEHARSAQRIYNPDRDRALAFRFGTDHGVVAHCFAGHALMGLGYLDQALAEMRAAVELADRLGHPFSHAYALVFETTQHWLRGDLEAQRATAEATLGVSEEQGFDLWIGLGRVYRAAAEVVSSGEAGALPELLEGSLVAGTTGNLAACTPVLACVAEAQLAAADLEGASGTIEGALAISRGTGQPWWDADLLRLKGLVALRSADAEGNGGGAASAERHFARAIALAREQGSPVLELRAATGLARLLAERGEADRGRELLVPAYERFTEGFSAGPLVAARATLEELGAVTPEMAGKADPGAADQAGSKPSVG